MMSLMATKMETKTLGRQAHCLISHGMSWPVPVQVSNSGKVIGWTSSILSRSKIVMTVTMMATVAIHCGDPGVFHGMGLPGELAAVPAGLHQAAASDSTPLTLPPLPTTAAHGSTSCLLTISPWWRVAPGFWGIYPKPREISHQKTNLGLFQGLERHRPWLVLAPHGSPPSPGLLSTSNRHHIQPDLENDHRC